MRTNHLRPLRGLPRFCVETVCRRLTALTAAAALLALLALAPGAAGAQLSAGDIVVADPNAFGGDGGLIAVNPASGGERPISNNDISDQKLFRDPTGVVFDPRSGTIVVADPNAFGGSGGVIRVDPASGQQTPLSSNMTSLPLFVDPVGVTLTPRGSLLVVDSGAGGGSGAVIEVDPATGQQSLLSSNAKSPTPLFAHPNGIAREPGGTIVVADPSTPAPASGTDGAIIAVDPDTGAQRLITSNDASQAELLADPLGVAIETPGTLLVANTASDPASDGVILVNRSSGQQYPLATEGIFAAPSAIAMDLDGKAVVADSEAFGGSGGVIRVDPVTGATSVVAGDPSAPGALFADPAGITVVPPTCLGRYATIVGTEAADALTGTPGPDVISARGGDDIVDGKQGGDLVCGDEGRDRLVGHDGNDRFLGGPGADVVLGGAGRDWVKGQTGGDRVDGGGGADRLYGQQKGDGLVGGAGDDLLRGGPGRDRLRGGPGRDRLRGGPGKDIERQ
jgi:sugar lactone lactonase YvrE